MKAWLGRIEMAALVACALALAGGPVHAQQFPAKPVKIVVGFATGGPTDVIARLLAQHMTTSMGQSVFVENKTGANALIATEEVARASADGYTTLFSSLSYNVNHILMPERVKYDPIKSFAPITLVATLPMIVVTGSTSPFGSLGDLIAQGKAKPGSISFGSAGNGGSAHLAGELLKSKTGIEMIHVPFRGNGPALMEVMAGRISYMFYPSIGVAEYVTGKRLKVLAVASRERNPDFPGVPTTDELGMPGLDSTAPWVGLLAPAGTPDAVVQRLANEVNKVMVMPEAKERLRALGAVAVGGTPAEFGAFLKSDHDHWATVIKAAGVKGE
jgi:tripartite-type tricarboxylate transporter receptor subunit TctC